MSSQHLMLEIVKATIVRRAGQMDRCSITLTDAATEEAYGKYVPYMAPDGLCMKFDAPCMRGEMALEAIGVDPELIEVIDVQKYLDKFGDAPKWE